MRGEEIKEFIYEPFNFKVYVSNYGRVFSKLGKELKKVYRGGKSKTYYINVGYYDKGKKRSYFSLPRLVYKLFIDNDLPKNCYVIHKDKNRLNCRADNLSLGLEKRKFEGDLSREQYKLFNNPVTLEYVRKKLWKWYDGDFRNMKDGITYDDLIQESLTLIYKALYHFTIIDNAEANSKNYRKFVYAIVEKFVCRHYHRDYKTKYYEVNF